jgi:succinate dehydrogenase / fumarate reductase flavoprotein subunit
MERYAPTIKDLAPRDMVSRAMYMEVREGRGAGPDNDYIHLDLTHIDAHIIETRLPDITEFARIYLGVDPVKELVPIQPTAHYAMGGIPTTINTEVIRDGDNTVVPGLYAAGEVACASLHGANRLGTNSLGDLIVFGRRAGIFAAQYAARASFGELPRDAQDFSRNLVDRALNGPGKERVSRIRKELQDTMQDNASVFRTEETLCKQIETLRELKARYREIGVEDRGEQYNTELMEALELGFLLDNAEALVHAAHNRKESRGAHSREDYKERDDDVWLKHTLVYKEGENVCIDYKPVTLGKYEPKPRVY